MAQGVADLGEGFITVFLTVYRVDNYLRCVFRRKTIDFAGMIRMNSDGAVKEHINVQSQSLLH